MGLGEVMLLYVHVVHMVVVMVLLVIRTAFAFGLALPFAAPELLVVFLVGCAGCVAMDIRIRMDIAETGTPSAPPTRVVDEYCVAAPIEAVVTPAPGAEESARGEVAPIVLGSIVSRLAKHFENVRGHDLRQRRYMTKVDY